MGIRTALAALRGATAFDHALKVVLSPKIEGGFSDDPRDPGGVTNLGVTIGTWRSWTGAPVSVEQMRHLTPKQVAPLYRERYWNRLHCDELPAGVALCVFDFGVNAGPSRAARYLQDIVGSTSDGQIGPKTINAVRQYCRLKSEAELIHAYSEARRNYYRVLRTFDRFGKGWLRRVDEVEQEALKL